MAGNSGDRCQRGAVRRRKPNIRYQAHAGGFLSTTTELGHRVVMTAEITAGVGVSHASRYTRRWLTQMYGRKLVCVSTMDRDEQLRRKVLRGRFRVSQISIW